MASTRNTSSSLEDSPTDLLSRASSDSLSSPDVTHSHKRRNPPSDDADISNKRPRSDGDASRQGFPQIAQALDYGPQFPRTLAPGDGQPAAIAHHASHAVGLQPSAAPGLSNSSFLPFTGGMPMGSLPGNHPYPGAWAPTPPSYYGYHASTFRSAYPHFAAQSMLGHSQPSQQAEQSAEGNDRQTQDLRALDELSDKMLCMLGGQDYEELDKDCARGHEYGRLKERFEGKMKQYTQGKPFVNPQTLGHLKSSHLSIVRKANLAACMSSIFGSRQIGLDTIQEQFQDVFVLPSRPLQPWQGDLLLTIKTQACIEALTEHQGKAFNEERDNIIQAFFPAQMEAAIVARRQAPKSLFPGEQEFVEDCAKRRQEFLDKATDFSGTLSLQAKYSFTELLQKVHGYIATSVKELSIMSNAPQPHQNNSVDRVGNFAQPVQQIQGFPQISYDDELRRNMVMANAAINGSRNSGPEVPPSSLPVYQAYPQVALQQQSYAPAQAPAVSSPPPQQQSAPTQALFDQARRTTSVRAPPNSRKPGGQNQRRAWSLEEERALLDGLDRVKGPHWSQILALYGLNGTVSEILKERNQVQLKDKARNLKLFFLKSNVEVPLYLQGVTGDLRTRAPAQAAKIEHAKLEEEKRRSEAQAAVQSLGDDRIMEAAATLVGGSRWPSADEQYASMPFATSAGPPSIDPALGHGSSEDTHLSEQLQKAMSNPNGQ